MATLTDLRRFFQRIDQHSYKAYKDLEPCYEFPDFTLWFDRIQGDPFASPSQCRVRLPQSQAGFPPSLYSSSSRAIALRDYITRQFACAAQEIRQRRGSGSSGLIAIAQPGQTVLERTSAWVTEQWVEVRFVVGLPALGRRVAGWQAIEMLCEDLPNLIDRSLRYAAFDVQDLQQHVETVEDADWLRQQLVTHKLVAFVPDGAVLPRSSGVDDRPLAAAVIPFQAPESLRVEFICPHRGRVTGMGIPAGITLIVGGGYHGKSTLLNAILLGVYNQIPGDGRELVVTEPTAIKIRAEDGRSITNVNISPLINHLPFGRSTTHFSTPNASGSTSQAANLMEALEAGTRLLLIDEDTSATNFMIRDRRMQALIAKEQEPITPFIDQVRQLYTEHGVSTILVMGGSGDYFDVADTIIAMQDYQPQDVTQRAKAIAQDYQTHRIPEGGQVFGALTPRYVSRQFDAGAVAAKWQVREVHTIALGRETIDLAAVEQLVDPAQLKAIAATLLYLQHHYLDGKTAIAGVLDYTLADLAAAGFDALSDWPRGDFAQFRRLELAAALNRWRSLS